MHGKTSLANRIASRERFSGFCAAHIEWDERFPIIDSSNSIVDTFHIVALVGKKGTFLQRDHPIGCRKDVNGDRGIRGVGRCRQLIQRQTGDTVHQHMTLVTPIILKTALIVLIGGGVDAESAVRVTLGMIFLGESVLRKGFRIILLCIRHDRRGIQPDEGRVHYAQRI